jgi:adenine-specific DNA-methyltransferase
MSYELILGDCLDVMRGMGDASIDLILTDPPYFRVKDEPWDRQWDTRDGFLAWMGELCEQWQRILKPNGSLYVFASPQMAWHVEGVIRQHFNVLSTIRWNKPAFSTKAEMFDKDTMRSVFPASENIIFAEQGNADEIADAIAGFSDAEINLKQRIFGDYLDAEFVRAGVRRKKIAALFPSVTGGLTGCVSNWVLGLNVPTREQYEAMRTYLNSLNCAEYLRQEYEELRQEYEDLRRPFNATPDAPYTDVWTFATVGTYPGKHPCEKPLELMRHMVQLSSRPDALVLDCFAGSGVTGEVCAQLGRRFVGIEKSRHWHSKALRRVAAAYADWQTAQRTPIAHDETVSDRLPLFTLDAQG